jgi:hypothetical protein
MLVDSMKDKEFDEWDKKMHPNDYKPQKDYDKITTEIRILERARAWSEGQHRGYVKAMNEGSVITKKAIEDMAKAWGKAIKK